MACKRNWPISLLNTVYGYHLYHSRNIPDIIEKSRDHIAYVDAKYQNNAFEDTKVIQREDYHIT
jgi:hypothetical protein